MKKTLFTSVATAALIFGAGIAPKADARDPYYFPRDKHHHNEAAEIVGVSLAGAAAVIDALTGRPRTVIVEQPVVVAPAPVVVLPPPPPPKPVVIIERPAPVIVTPPVVVTPRRPKTTVIVKQKHR
ncbi:MAG: hypothetical protein J6P93_05530 [Alphaproteobacteria bacterium]|nr:hypothetical protein [Alphaproteobacteria bacterium]